MHFLRPPPGLDVAEKAKAQLLAATVLVAIGAHLSAVLMVWYHRPEAFSGAEWGVLVVSVLAELVALVLSRTRHFRYGVALIGAVALMTPLLGALYESNPARVTRLYAYAAVGNLFIGLFVRPRVALITTLGTVTAVVLSAMRHPSLSGADVYGVFALVLVCGVAGWLHATMSAYANHQREQLQQRMMLTDRLTALGSLVSGIGLELHSPLTYVRANVEFLLQLELGNADEDVTQALEDTLEGVERMTALVAELRRFSQPPVESLGLVDLDDVLRVVLRVSGPQLQHRVEVEIDSTPEEVWVRGEAHRLEQVLLHLVANATRALEDVESPRLSLRIHADRPMARMVVEDNGPGVPPTLADRVFEPFTTGRQAGHGSGLGLALCQRIITAHHGSLLHEPVSGGGARFIVELPLLDQVLTPPPTQERRPPLALGKVLLIDDEPLIGRALARSFPSAEVTVAHDGEEALVACEAKHYDLVLCDIHMPRSDGRDFYERLLEFHPLQAARVVFMTGGSIAAETTAWLKHVDLPVLYKPIDRRQLVKALQTLGGGLERPTGRRVLPRTPEPPEVRES